jgi:regulator of sirC expression with transglutaminase-like and TPR domain
MTDVLLTLLARDDAEVERAALLVAADAQPGLDVAASLAKLDEMAEALSRPGALGHSPVERARAIALHVHETLDFRGNRESYYDPRNSYLSEVITRRLGIPLTLSIVWIAIARRAGALVEGIGFPGHFLVRVGGPEGVLADPFHEGRVLAEADLARLVTRFQLGPLTPQHTEPVGTTAMIVRLLSNLKHAHERRGDHQGALLTCDRLYDITSEPEHRRDRGLHALALGSYATAADDLAAYLELRPTARDVRALEDALARARAMGGRTSWS